MTKLRSKKMTKSTFAVIIMAIAMVAMLAFGGTYAYFTAEAKDSKTTVSIAKLELTLGDVASTTTTTSFVPGQKFFNATTFPLTDGDTSDGVDMYAFAKISATSTITGVNGGKPVELFYAKAAAKDLTETSEGSGLFINADQFASIVTIELSDTNGETAGHGQAWTNVVNGANEVEGVYGVQWSVLTADDADAQLKLDGTFESDVDAHRVQAATGTTITEYNNVYYYDATANDNNGAYIKLSKDFEGLSVDVVVEFVAIQTVGFADNFGTGKTYADAEAAMYAAYVQAFANAAEYTPAA